jgi:hypothetical protein
MNELFKNGYFILLGLALGWFLATSLIITVCVFAVPATACVGIGIAWAVTSAIFFYSAFGYAEQVKKNNRGVR